MTRHVTICVCTFRRPDLLARCLHALNELQTDGAFSYSVVVADNDASESARPVVERVGQSTVVPVTYRVEPVQNIALARNRAIAAADGDFVAFIDDDEFPVSGWLAEMLAVCDRTGCDGVLGPVRPFFDEAPPRWIVRGRFYDRPEHATGCVLHWKDTRTGNVLMRREVLDEAAPAFRAEFGNGGEDQDFFRRAIARGRRFLWCNEAVVFEVVPPERRRRSYLLKRALLRGQNEKLILSLPSIAKSAIAVPIYLLSLPVMFLLGQHHFMRSAIRLLDHSGKLLSAAGVTVVRGHYLNG